MIHLKTVRYVFFVAAAILAFATCDATADQPEIGERHALLIGITGYHPDRFANLPGAEPDVKELALVLTSNGYAHEHVTVMTNRAGASDPRKLPTASKIRKQLKRLAKIRGGKDSIIIALAGHGVQRKSGEYFFCPQDADLAKPKSLISINEIYQALEASGAGFKVLLIDACREDVSGGSFGGDAVASGGIQSVTRSKRTATQNLPEPPRGTAAFFSCMPGQLAYERHGKHGINGVFFHAVVQGLKGAAAGEDGSITLPDLERFVKKDVETFVYKTYAASQHPVIRNNTIGLMPLVAFSASDRTIAEARRLLIRGRRSEASKLIDSLLEGRPDDALALGLKAEMLSEVANSRKIESLMEAAFQMAQRAVDLGPDEAGPYLARANIRFLREELDEAIADYGLAIECDPNCAIAYAKRSVIFLQQKDTEAMLRDIEKSLEIDDSDPTARALYAAEVFSLGRMDEGFAVLDLGIDLTPDVPTLHFMKGYGLDLQKRYDKAILAYSAAIRLDNQDDDVLCRRAISLARVGDYPAALEDAQAAEEVNPNNLDIVAARVFVLNQQQRYREAIPLLDDAIRRDGANKSWYQMRSRILKHLGRHAESQRDQQKFSELSQS